MIKFSGVIITYNEARSIEKCILSLLKVVDEIIIVDSFSTDNTKSICEKYNVTFIEQEFLGYVKQKNFALNKANYDYIISLDGDESLSDELQKSVLALKTNWEFDGYYCNRSNYFCGQWIKHSDWYPDKKLRVFDRRTAEWAGYRIHEKVGFHKKDTTIGKLNGDILHWTHQTYSEFNLKVELFSGISANAYFERGKKSSLLKIVWHSFWAFFKAYIFRLGFLDGINGLVISVQAGNLTFLKYTKLYELQKHNK